MEIASVRDKKLKRFITSNDRRILEPDRLADMIAFIVSATEFDDLRTPPNFGFHALTGNRTGIFAMTVTRNWRLTFTKVDDHSIADLALEDYHGN